MSFMSYADLMIFNLNLKQFKTLEMLVPMIVDKERLAGSIHTYSVPNCQTGIKCDVFSV